MRRLCGDRGIALIGVLWLVALLSVFAAGMVSLVRSDSLTAKSVVDNARAEAFADAGVYVVLHEMGDPGTAHGVPVDGRARTFSVAGQPVTVSVADEAGKVDVNFAPVELIQSLLEVCGLRRQESITIADAIAGKRAAFGDPAERGGDVAFHSIDEVDELPGIGDEVFGRLRSSMTVYSRSQEVAIGYAPKRVLLALPGMDAAKVERLLAARGQPSGSETRVVAAGAGGENLEGRAFTLLSTAREGERAYVRRAVVRMTGDIRAPFWILEWDRLDE